MLDPIVLIVALESIMLRSLRVQEGASRRGSPRTFCQDLANVRRCQRIVMLCTSCVIASVRP